MALREYFQLRQSLHFKQGTVVMHDSTLENRWGSKWREHNLLNSSFLLQKSQSIEVLVPSHMTMKRIKILCSPTFYQPHKKNWLAQGKGRRASCLRSHGTEVYEVGSCSPRLLSQICSKTKFLLIKQTEQELKSIHCHSLSWQCWEASSSIF